MGFTLIVVWQLQRVLEYTFKAHGQIYHMLDQLMPGVKGPRHMQLYFYDTDKTMHHRMKRSPHLDANVIRTILNIMQRN
jgi:hypothetical protein